MSMTYKDDCALQGILQTISTDIKFTITQAISNEFLRFVLSKAVRWHLNTISYVLDFDNGVSQLNQTLR